MSAKFETVKNYYEAGLWNIEKVRTAVAKNWITAEEFKKITGKTYE